MSKSLYIGNTEIVISADCDLEISDCLKEYENPIITITNRVFFELVFSEFQPFPMKLITSIANPPIIIGRTENGEGRIFQSFTSGIPEALYEELSPENIRLTLFHEKPEFYTISFDNLNFFSLEKQMIKGNAIILHSSFIVHEQKAVLFTAPSGTGKSTQAELWEKYANARVMNGDRTLLVPTESGWRACGFPFSGSSNIYWNGVYPIAGLAMIYQSPDNVIQEIPLSKAYRKTYPEIVNNHWNPEFEVKVMSILEDFLGNTKFIRFGCNMEQDAVTCLKDILEK